MIGSTNVATHEVLVFSLSLPAQHLIARYITRINFRVLHQKNISAERRNCASIERRMAKPSTSRLTNGTGRDTLKDNEQGGLFKCVSIEAR